MDEYWIRHFSQANPLGPNQENVPLLLRRVADTIEALGHATITDITFGTEITDDGPWNSLTVYYHLPGDADRVRPKKGDLN